MTKLLLFIIALGTFSIAYEQFIANHIAQYDLLVMHGDVCQPNWTIPDKSKGGLWGLLPPTHNPNHDENGAERS